MTITFVGSVSANSETLDLSSLGSQSGDIIVLHVFRNNSTVSPTIPAGWVGVVSGSGATAWLGLFFCEHGSSLPTIGTWTNATQMIAVAYRPTTGRRLIVSRAAATGGTIGSGGDVVYTNLPQIATPIDSWILGAVGHRSIDTDCQVAPSGMTNRGSVVGGAAGELAVHDTDGTQQSWSSTNYTLTTGTSSGYRTHVAQLAECVAYIPSGGGSTVVPHPLHYTPEMM